MIESTRTLSPRLLSPMILVAVTFLLSLVAAHAHGQPTGNESFLQGKTLSPDDDAPSSDRFTGSLTVRQKGASLYYKIYIVRGIVIGGYETWRGRSTHYHRIVGGWYDGERMVLLIQSAQNDFGDKWYSHAHHFEKQGDQFVIKHTLYGFGKTIETGEVYTPHTIDEIAELHAEQVKQLAEPAELEATPPPTVESEEKSLAKRNKELARENARLKELVAELILDKMKLQGKLRDK